MQAPLDHIYLSAAARDELIKLKRVVRIEQWNVYCRWAFCISMANPARVSAQKPPSDSNAEMSWKVFAGHHEEAYMALLLHRCHEDGIAPTPANLGLQLRAHIHRGIFSPKLKELLTA